MDTLPVVNNLKFRRKLLSPEVTISSFDTPCFLVDLIAQAGYPGELRENIVAVVDRNVIDRSEWETLVVTPDQGVFLGVVPAGGDTARQALIMAAVIAVTYFTAGALSGPAGAAGGAFGAAGGGLNLAGHIAVAAVTVATSLTLNSLFPPPGADSESSAEQTYGLTGTNNRARPYQGVRRVLGRRKVFPDIAALPFTVTQGDTQYLYTIFDFGPGPLWIEDIRIGNTPITQYNEVDMNYISEAQYGDQLQIYKNDHSTVAVGALLEHNIPLTPIIRATDGQANAVVIDVLFPGGLYRTNKEGDLKSNAMGLRIRWKKTSDSVWNSYNLAATDVIGTGLSSPQAVQVFSNTVVDDAVYTGNWYAGSKNIYNYTIAAGTTVFDIFSPGFVPEEGQIVYIGGQKMTIQSLVNTGINRHNITMTTALQVDAYVSRIQDNGTPPLVSEVSIGANYYELLWESQALATDEIVVSRKVQQPFTMSFGMKFPLTLPDTETNPPQFDVEVTRTSTNDANTRNQSVCYFQSLRTIRLQSPINYRTPHSIIEMRIKATDQINGNVDTLSAVCTSLVNIYDDTGAIISANALSRNPASLALHVLLSDEAAFPVDPSRIDWPKWNEFRLWCNELVDIITDPPTVPADQEFRATCDLDIVGSGTVQQVVEKILNTARATISIADGMYSVIYDAPPVAPIQLITTQNTQSATASRSFIEQADAIRATFVDPQSDWEQGEIVVWRDPNDIPANPKYEDMDFAGLTRSNQVYRDTRYFMATALLRQEDLTINMDWENLLGMRGDYVLVQDDAFYIGGLPGRVVSVSGNDITSTESFNITAGPTWVMQIRNSFGDLTQVNITAQVDSNTVTVDVVPPNLAKNDLLVWGQLDSETEGYIIKSVTPQGDLNASVKLMQLALPVYTSDTDPIPDYDPGISPDLTAVGPITPTLEGQVIVLSQTDNATFTLAVNWNPVDTVVSYQVLLWTDTEPEWTVRGVAHEGEGQFILFQNLTLDTDDKRYDDEYRVKVVGTNTWGRTGSIPDAPIAIWNPFDDPSLGGIPPVLPFFDIDVRSEEVFLQWSVPDDFFSNAGFIIKFTPDLYNPVWNGAMLLARDVPANSRGATFPARVGSYMIKMVSLQGLTNAVPNIASTTVPGLPNLRYLETLDDAPDWNGTKLNVENIHSALYMIKDADGYVTDPGVYTYLSELFSTEISTVRFASYFRWFAAGHSDMMVDWVPNIQDYFDNNSPQTEGFLSEPAPEGACDALQQIRVYDTKEGTDTDWQTFVVGDYTGNVFQFRILMGTSDEGYTPVVGSGEVLAEVLYRMEEQFDLVADQGGQNVRYDKAFYAPPALAVTATRSINEWYDIWNQTEYGFSIQFYTSDSGFRSAGAKMISGVFDYQARGYGAIEQSASLYQYPLHDSEKIPGLQRRRSLPFRLKNN